MDWENIYYSEAVQERWKVIAMKTHHEVVQEWRQDPAFIREYDAGTRVHAV